MRAVLTSLLSSLVILGAAYGGYQVAKAERNLDEVLMAAPVSQVQFYVAKDNDGDKRPTEGDMVSFFIDPTASMSGPWVISLTCWGAEDKSAVYLNVADPASLNQPFYVLESDRWPADAPAYCEYLGTQGGVEFGSGSFVTY